MSYCMKKYSVIFTCLLVCICMNIHAKTYYSCDFENEADRNHWTLNPTANQSVYNNLTNKWYIGAHGNYSPDGQYSLYISDDNGENAHYSPQNCWVFAYDTLALPRLSTGDYILSFDYCGMGNMASDFDGLYVLWIPMTDPDTWDSIRVMSLASANGIPPAYENYLITLQPKYKDYLNGSITWKQCVTTIPKNRCDGKTHYLAFVWANGNNSAQQPGGMIDNIQIIDTTPCDAPTGLTVNIQESTTLLSWDGTADAYEVTAYSYEKKTWLGPKTVNENQTSFENLPVGFTDFVVRAQCDENEYSLKSSINKLIYYPDQMCIDYLNLKNATCYINNENNRLINTITYSDFIQTNPVDNGPAQMSSRHTIHFDKNELEQRTGNMAKTIPDGELASVRLGNWDTNAQAERIEYSLVVDTAEFPVLLLKYLVILEAPNHNDHENPRFTLDILIDGRSIGECAQADFSANDVLVNRVLTSEAAEQGWHLTPRDQSQTSSDVVWKDWTTVGIDLRNPAYEGKTLTVRLTTFDCVYSAHCGYAYFTLGCSNGKMKGMQCTPTSQTYEAAEGFQYRWMYASSEQYRQPDGSMPEQYVLGHGQKYEVALEDNNLYMVDCMFLQDSSCFFSLYSSAFDDIERNATETEVTTTQAEPTYNNVVLDWPKKEEAVLYAIIIMKGNILICSLTFNQYGQLLNISFAAPSRHGNGYQAPMATQTATGWQYTVNGLNPDTEYTYTVIAKKSDDTVVYEETIPFKTQSTSTAIDQISQEPIANSQKLIKDGQLFILRGDKVYTLTGQEIR